MDGGVWGEAWVSRIMRMWMGQGGNASLKEGGGGGVEG